MIFRLSLLLAGTLAAQWCGAEPPVATMKPSLTLAGGRRVVAAALEEARRLAAPGGAVAVVDAGGNLICVERLDGTFAAAPRISIGKARTAAIFQRPTSVFEKVIRDGRTPMVALEDFTPLQGGVPVELDGQIVGAVGVSGAASAQQDDDIAQVAARALSTGPAPAGGERAAMTGAAAASTGDGGVTYFSADTVGAAFARGAPLVDDGAAGYRIHASRRDKAGLAEVHEDETDIIYVQEGTATVVTGGAAVEAREIAPGEIRGSAIEGGETRKLGVGDVLIVPRGVPHWFQEVPGTLRYYVVKVR